MDIFILLNNVQDDEECPSILQGKLATDDAGSNTAWLQSNY
jgi:hypothetical protein